MTPAKSASSKKSERASDEDVNEENDEEVDEEDEDEEDSHLITITERTYEESITNQNASQNDS